MGSGDEARRPTVASTAGRIFVVAVALNLVWEMAQFPLYAWHGTWPQALWLGARASITDGAFVLLIYAGGVIAFRRRDWYVRPGAGGYALTILVGATWAAAVELSALKNGRWSYGPFMPQLEWLGGVGVLPIVQMIVLPPLIFRVVARRDTR